MRPHGSPEQLESRRRHAVELLITGMSVPAVAQATGCPERSIYYWSKAYREHGDEGLKAKPVPGRPPKLDARQKKELTRILLKGAVESGYPTDLWTSGRITQVIEVHFGVHYNPHSMWEFLHRLGWTCQKPGKQALERDEEAIERWKHTRWLEVKKKPENQGRT